MSNLPAYLTAFESFVRATSGLRRAGSASLDLAYTACGRYDGFFEVGLFAWDLAGGALLVTEAGGVVTTVRGGSDVLEQGSIVAAGSRLHAAMLALTKGRSRESVRGGRFAFGPFFFLLVHVLDRVLVHEQVGQAFPVHLDAVPVVPLDVAAQLRDRCRA
jgi:hypothetical protein